MDITQERESVKGMYRRERKGSNGCKQLKYIACCQDNEFHGALHVHQKKICKLLISTWHDQCTII